MKKLTLILTSLILTISLAFAGTISIPFPGPGLGPFGLGKVAFDAKGTSNGYATGTTSITFSNLTIGSGFHRALIVTLAWSTAPTAPSCTWDNGGTNQSMTLIQQASNTRSVALFGLVAPASGNKTLLCSWTGSPTDAFVDAISFINVDQTGGATTFYNATSNTGTATTPNVTVTSATTDGAVDIVGNVSVSSSPGQTLLFLDNTHGALINAGSSYNINSASVAFAWTSTVTLWVDLGVALKNG